MGRVVRAVSSGACRVRARRPRAGCRARPGGARRRQCQRRRRAAWRPAARPGQHRRHRTATTSERSSSMTNRSRCIGAPVKCGVWAFCCRRRRACASFGRTSTRRARRRPRRCRSVRSSRIHAGLPGVSKCSRACWPPEDTPTARPGCGVPRSTAGNRGRLAGADDQMDPGSLHRAREEHRSEAQHSRRPAPRGARCRSCHAIALARQQALRPR